MYKYFVNSDKLVKNKLTDRRRIERTDPDDYIRATMKYSFLDQHGEETICKLLTQYIRKCDKVSKFNMYDPNVKVSRIRIKK